MNTGRRRVLMLQHLFQRSAKGLIVGSVALKSHFPNQGVVVRAVEMLRGPICCADAPEVRVLQVGVACSATGIVSRFGNQYLFRYYSKPLTAVGTELLFTVPSPSAPLSFLPQHRTFPPVISAQVCQPPADTAVALVIPTTVTGAVLFAVVPLPS